MIINDDIIYVLALEGQCDDLQKEIITKNAEIHAEEHKRRADAPAARGFFKIVINELITERNNITAQRNKIIEIIKHVRSAAPYAAHVIHDRAFVGYIKETLITDVLNITSSIPKPLNKHINWEAVADEYKENYKRVELTGETYWAPL